jgi:hypothetical protein
MSGYEPTPLAEPDTQSVPGGRRAAVAVALVAILVVGTLLWKPWDSGGGAPASPGPSGSLPAVAAATPTATASATATLQSSPPPATTSPDQEETAPGGFGSVLIAPGAGSFVYCVYGSAEARLISLVVNEPFIILSDDPEKQAQVKRMTYKPEIESNSLESVFSADWSFLTAGDTQRRSVGGRKGLFFDAAQIKVKVQDLPDSSVLRVAVVINWIGADGERLATQRIYPTKYGRLGDDNIEPVAEGCSTRT